MTTQPNRFRPVGQDRATAIARARVSSDCKVSLSGRTPVALDDDAVWHVSFPSSDTSRRGGAPNVDIRKSDGAIISVRYTP
jgi:hypothetical protein